MRSVWGSSPQMPRPMLDAVAAHAGQLGRTIISDDLFLLALTESDEATPARRALAAAGVNTMVVLAEIRVTGDRPLGPPPPLHFAPAFYAMQGRAEGFAAALGDGSVTPESVLLAVLWDPMSHSSQLLWRLHVSRERIVGRLEELGVPVPATPLPHQREIEYGERVWFSRSDVRPVLDHLRLHIPPGTQWRFNYEGDRAWACAEARVDLPALVRAAVAATSRGGRA